MAPTVSIHPLSLVAIHLECSCRGTALASGTGFVVTRSGLNYLITNWHVVTGRRPETGDPVSDSGAADPDTVAVWYHAANRLGSWVQKSEPLLDPGDGAPKWIEHPRGREIDVVALRLPHHQDVRVYPLDLRLAETDLVISPSEAVSIIGFPLGFAAAGKIPIWKTGHVASDIDIDYDGKPVFLIDATTRPGMSGSPVVVLKIGLRRTSSGWELGGGEFVRFLGVYSGRVEPSSELGMVWKATVLDEILR